ncbi:MAG: alpha/beta hydrolase [Flavobacteriales bacterium]|nr:alpha/beta hydrolase [Flavobacteriales bacterium]
MRKTLRTGPVEWSCLDNEEGDEVWLTFHGYGQEAEVMQHFMKTFRPNARVLSFDLPLHGKTVSDKQRPLSVKDLIELQEKVLQETGAKKCSVLGFSLGGKLVLKMVELVPTKLESIVLIAPDGLKTNPLYWFVTHTLIGKWLFQLMILFPQPLLGISKLLAITQLMNPKIHDFVSSQMSTKAKRQKVLDSWMMFRDITPSLNLLRTIISDHELRPYLVFGTKDRVIHPKLAKKLSRNNCRTADVIMLDAGHNLTTKEIALQIRDRMQ